MAPPTGRLVAKFIVPVALIRVLWNCYAFDIKHPPAAPAVSKARPCQSSARARDSQGIRFGQQRPMLAGQDARDRAFRLRRPTRALVEHGVLSKLMFRNVLAVAAVIATLLDGSVPVAHAEVVAVPDVIRQVTTYDGWQLTLSLTDARYDAVPNMANAVLTKEGYLSGRVTLTVDGVGDHPINTGQLVVGAQLGCQVDLSDGLDLGMNLDTDVFDDDSVVGVRPDIGTTLKSGGIEAVGFGAKPLKGPIATISILDAHVHVDQCGGAVTARLFASATISSDTSDDALNVYGEVLPL